VEVRSRSGSLGGRYAIDSTREQILDVLVSSFEDVARANESLRKRRSQREVLFEQERPGARSGRGGAGPREDANKAKSEFLAMMSHDLRTSAQRHGGYAELLAMGVRGPVYARRRLPTWLGSRAISVTWPPWSTTCSASRGTGDRRDPAPACAVALDPIVRPLRAVISPQMTKRNIAYEYVGCSTAVRVVVDPERLDQILINLLGNAVKFTEDGGRIEVRCREGRGYGIVEVVDNGVGIPDAQLESIFEPFVQIERNHGKRDGVGLGLAISRKARPRLGGDVTVTSVETKGSTFSVKLPLATTPDDRALPEENLELSAPHLR
jgi:signal transduction histidine kinase